MQSDKLTNSASVSPRSAIWRRLEDIRLWLQKQADECRQSAEQIEGRVRAGRPFNGDENVAAHNRNNQQFFQTKADTISEAQDTALRACAEAPATDKGPTLDIDQIEQWLRADMYHNREDWGDNSLSCAEPCIEALVAEVRRLRAEALAPSPDTPGHDAPRPLPPVLAALASLTALLTQTLAEKEATISTYVAEYKVLFARVRELEAVLVPFIDKKDETPP